MTLPAWDAVERRAEILITNICKVFLLLQVIVVSYVVFGRFVLNSTPGWGEELSLLCMVWFSLLSIGLGITGDTHIGMNLADLLFPARFKPYLAAFSRIVEIGLAVFMIHAGWNITRLASMNTMSGLGVPASLLFASIPVGGVFMLAAVLLKLPNRRKQNG